MTSRLGTLRFDALDPVGLAQFWSDVLGWEQDDLCLLPPDDLGFRIRFTATTEPKSGPNQMHFDLTSTSPADQEATVSRVLGLGGRHHDVGQLPEEPHVVLADPEGNEFCVIEPGNAFLAGCGPIGALSSDGSQAVGYFWSAALGWPLVWDQDEETAIQAPSGGPKITWGGPPVAPKVGRNRLHFDLVADDLALETERLVAAGAHRLDAGSDRVAMADPDGNEFCLLAQTRTEGC